MQVSTTAAEEEEEEEEGVEEEEEEERHMAPCWTCEHPAAPTLCVITPNPPGEWASGPLRLGPGQTVTHRAHHLPASASPARIA
ncbi:unnamed protein product [Boreogadus saida]